MLVQNIYYSNGSCQIDGKTINFDNVIIEGLDDKYNQFETKVFGLKQSQIKVKREQFLKALGNKPIEELENKNVEFYYDSNRRLVQISVIK